MKRPKDKRRRPYESPRVKSEKMLERQALVCGQKVGGSPSCRRLPST